MPRSRANADSDFDAVSTVSNATTHAHADTIFTSWRCRPPNTNANSVSTRWTCRRSEQVANTDSNAKEEMAANQTPNTDANAKPDNSITGKT